MPYFSGPKKVECTPIRNSTIIRKVMLPVVKAKAASAMMAISAALMTWMIRCFSNLSASRPAVAEKRKKGRMKMPVAIVTMSWPLTPDAWARLKVTRMMKRVLEQIVVEGAQELGDEQRQEAPALEDAEILAHGRNITASAAVFLSFIPLTFISLAPRRGERGIDERGEGKNANRPGPSGARGPSAARRR